MDRTVSGVAPIGEPGHLLILQPPQRWFFADLRTGETTELPDVFEYGVVRGLDRPSAAIATVGDVDGTEILMADGDDLVIAPLDDLAVTRTIGSGRPVAWIPWSPADS